MNESCFYFEYLSARQFLSLITFNKIFRKSFTLGTVIYFVDESTFSRHVFRRLIKLTFNICIIKLKFKLKDIKDERGESLQYRFLQKDLYQMLEIFDGNLFIRSLDKPIDDSIKFEFKHYIKKAIIGHSILSKDSIARKIYLINVIYELKRQVNNNNFLILDADTWLPELNKYSKKYNIKVISTKSGIKPLAFIRNVKLYLRYKNTYFYFVLRSLNIATLNTSLSDNTSVSS